MVSTHSVETDSARVLCVDDEQRVLDGLENHIAMEYDVCLATSGESGLEVIRSEGPFAVVISDMRMPRMDGATFLQRVRETAPDTTQNSVNRPGRHRICDRSDQQRKHLSIFEQALSSV